MLSNNCHSTNIRSPANSNNRKCRVRCLPRNSSNNRSCHHNSSTTNLRRNRNSPWLHNSNFHHPNNLNSIRSNMHGYSHMCRHLCNSNRRHSNLLNNTTSLHHHLHNNNNRHQLRSRTNHHPQSHNNHHSLRLNNPPLLRQPPHNTLYRNHASAPPPHHLQALHHPRPLLPKLPPTPRERRLRPQRTPVKLARRNNSTHTRRSLFLPPPPRPLPLLRRLRLQLPARRLQPHPLRRPPHARRRPSRRSSRPRWCRACSTASLRNTPSCSTSRPRGRRCWCRTAPTRGCRPIRGPAPQCAAWCRARAQR